MCEACTFSGEAGLSPFASTAGVFFVTMIRCQPNWVLTGSETLNGSLAKATLSNSGTIWPRVNSPRSPPFALEGHAELAFATSANLFVSAAPVRPSKDFFRTRIFASASNAFFWASFTISSTFFASTVILEVTSCSMSFWITRESAISLRPRALPNGLFSAISSKDFGAPGRPVFALTKSASCFLRSSSETFTPFFAASSNSAVFMRNC